MILFILLALLIAKIRGKRVRCVFNEVSLIPLFVLEAVFWVFQIFAWCGNYTFVPYGGYLEEAFILAMLWPILKFRLYKAAIIAGVMTIAGSILNRIVVRANDGAMPVLPTLSKITGYYTDQALAASGDAGHRFMTSATRLNFLGDYIDVGFSVMSIGDILIHMFITIIVYKTISALNAKKG